MRPTLWLEVKRVFAASLDVAAAEREAFVRLNCPDAQTCEEVLRLVRRREKLTQFLHAPTAARVAPGPALSESVGPDGKRYTRSDTAESPPPQTPPQLAAGAVIVGRYELGDRLGAGAFGAVHRAKDRLTGQDVAVKVVAIGSEVHERAYDRELAALHHARLPGVVELLDDGVQGAWAFLVMRLIVGVPFPGPVAPGRWEPVVDRAVRLFEAVNRLHSAGVFHRDLKPANVLVDADGAVTIVDLGIAEDDTDPRRWAAAQAIAGTLLYLAPERLGGARATARTDLFSLGVMLFEALAGRPPWGADVCTSLPSPEKSPASMLRETAPHVPVRIAALVDDLLAPDPERRPIDVEAALTVLRDVRGAADGFCLPLLGDGTLVRRIVAAAEAGESIDIVGAAGTGRSRVLAETELALSARGRSAWRLSPSPEILGGLRELLVSGEFAAGSISDLSQALQQRLDRLLHDGVVLLVDDADAMDAVTRGLLARSRARGAVVRVLSQADGPCVETTHLSEADLRELVAGVDRLTHLREDVARILWRQSGGNQDAVRRTVHGWVAAGLAQWDGRLHVRRDVLPRLGTPGEGFAAACERAPALDPAARSVWLGLSLATSPLPVPALARVCGQPQWSVEIAVGQLRAQGLAHVGRDRTCTALVPSPDRARLSGEERRALHARIAEELLSESDRRIHHLVRAERFEDACRTSVGACRAAIVTGRLNDAVACASAALAIARRWVPANPDLYADLLALMSDAAVSSTTLGPINTCLYHAELAPFPDDVRVRATSALLRAAAAFLHAGPQRTLSALAAIESLPTEDHRRLAHVIEVAAARAAGDHDAHRRVVRRAAEWARQRPDRDARALVAAWTGWLRYDEGRFAAACRLHSRAGRLARRARARVNALCNGAISAIEAGELAAAEALARSAVGAAADARDVFNEARAELLLRQVAYRRGRAAQVDEELLCAASALEPGTTRGLIELTEAAVAWRLRRLLQASQIAETAARTFEAAGQPTLALLARSLGAASRIGTNAVLGPSLRESAGKLAPAGVASQISALAAAALGPARVPAAMRESAAIWAASAVRPEEPREILSPSEVAERVAVSSGA